MRAIEAGVRNIYDRIDALEATYAVTPDEIDRLTREMGGVAEALKHPGDAEVLDRIVGRLDALSGQIDGMGQVGDVSVSALRSEVDNLRDAVGEAMAPRFAALESRLENLRAEWARWRRLPASPNSRSRCAGWPSGWIRPESSSTA